MSAHTKGPWMVRGGQSVTTPNDEQGYHLLIASVHETSVRKDDPDHAEADARLIAAAPELLAACQEAIPLLIRLGDFVGNGEGPTGNERCDAILVLRYAIAKAEGRS